MQGFDQLKQNGKQSNETSSLPFHDTVCTSSVPVKQRPSRFSTSSYLANTTLLQTHNSYINLAVPKNQPEISRMNFPYCLQDQAATAAPKKIKTRIKIMNQVRQSEKQNSYVLRSGEHTISKQEAPVNEYLSYEISSQINEGLYDVKVIAEEIKQIKRAKQLAKEDKDKQKPIPKTRAKKVTEIRGGWLRNPSSFFSRS